MQVSIHQEVELVRCDRHRNGQRIALSSKAYVHRAVAEGESVRKRRRHGSQGERAESSKWRPATPVMGQSGAHHVESAKSMQRRKSIGRCGGSSRDPMVVVSFLRFVTNSRHVLCAHVRLKGS